jgi:hypothetical protein
MAVPEMARGSPGNQLKLSQHVGERGVEFRRTFEHEPVAHAFRDITIEEESVIKFTDHLIRNPEIVLEPSAVGD